MFIRTIDYYNIIPFTGATIHFGYQFKNVSTQSVSTETSDAKTAGFAGSLARRGKRRINVHVALTSFNLGWIIGSLINCHGN
jgi:hypothetical protein